MGNFDFRKRWLKELIEKVDDEIIKSEESYYSFQNKDGEYVKSILYLVNIYRKVLVLLMGELVNLEADDD